MKRTLTLGTLSIIASLALVSCGGSSSVSDLVEEAVANSSETLTGYFIDAAVEGLEYEATPSGKSGTTDANGTFEYSQGDRVKFRLGKMDLGEGKPDADGLMTPEKLVDNEALDDTQKENKKVLMLRLLQSLDSDNNLTNGISIDEEVIEALKNGDLNETKFVKFDEAKILGMHKKMEQKIDKDGNGIIDVDFDNAMKHFEESKAKWDEGERPNHSGKKPNDLNKTIIKELELSDDCDYPVAGIIEYSDKNGTVVKSVDYGSGECDSMVTVIHDGNSTEVDLSQKPPMKEEGRPKADDLNQTIVEEVVTSEDCNYPLSGIVEYSNVEGVVVKTLNYGDGECDSIVTVTTENNTTELDLSDRPKKDDKRPPMDGEERPSQEQKAQ